MNQTNNNQTRPQIFIIDDNITMCDIEFSAMDA